MVILIAFGVISPAPTQKRKLNLGGDWTSATLTKSTISASPTEKTVARRGSTELRSVLETPWMMRAIQIPGGWLEQVSVFKVIFFWWIFKERVLRKYFSLLSFRCAIITSIAAGDTQTFQCNGMEGRFVNIVIPGKLKILTLCEVQVYGDPLPVVLPKGKQNVMQPTICQW